MKKSFARQLSNLNTYEDTLLPNIDNERMYQLVTAEISLDKTAKRKPRIFKTRTLLVAIISAFALAVTAAAYYYSVSDVFRDVLTEKSPDGETVPISTLADIVDKSGAVANEIAVSEEGIDITVKGIVGDANSLKILLDIFDKSGKALAILQPDGTYSEGRLDFGRIKMRTDNTLDRADVPFNSDIQLVTNDGSNDMTLGYANVGFIGGDLANGKATLLIDVTVDGVDLNILEGERLYITLTDILQNAFSGGEEIGVSENALYHIVSRFDEISENDLQKSGFQQDYATGETIWQYRLITDSGKEISLSDSLPKYMVTNAGFCDDVFYLRIKAPNKGSDADSEQIELSYPALLNTQTGDYITCAGGRSDDGKNIVWDFAFSGISSTLELRDYTLVINYGNGTYNLSVGEWNFEIPLDFENTTRTIEISENFNIGEFELYAEKFIVSPYYIAFYMSADEENYEKMNHRENPITVLWNPIETGITDWDKTDVTASVYMNDGNCIEIAMSGYNMNRELICLNFDLDVVIDPEQIERIEIGDLMVKCDVE